MIVSGAEMYRFSSKLWYNKRAVSSTGEASLYLQVTIDGKHKEFNLKLRWLISHIDFDKGILLPRYKNDQDLNPFTIAINTQLSRHNDINRAFLLRNEMLDINKFTKQLACFDDKESLAAYMENERTRRKNKKEIDEITYKNAGSVARAILKYDDNPKFNKINAKWMSGFKSFLRKYPYKKDTYYKDATIWTFIKVAKTYLRLASEEPLIYVDPAAIDFPNPEPAARTEYLEREELRRLLILQRSGNITDLQERVLKAFIFQCYTGLRISDIYKANNTWRLQQNTLSFLPHKNRKLGKWLKITLMGPALEIIKKCTANFFDLPNKQQYNETLKDLADKAEINKNLHSHLGRHTFGFLFMTSVGNLYALQELLGHSKIDHTQRYAHLNQDYKAQEVSKMADSIMDYTI